MHLLLLCLLPSSLSLALHSYLWHCLASDRSGLAQARGCQMSRHGMWDVFFREPLITTICKVIAPQFIMPLMMTRTFTHSSCVITPLMSRNASPTWFLNHLSLWRAYAFLPLHWHSADTLFLHLTLPHLTELSGRWSTSTTVCTHVCMHTHPANPSVGVLKREGTCSPHVLPGSGRLFTREVKQVFGWRVSLPFTSLQRAEGFHLQTASDSGLLSMVSTFFRSSTELQGWPKVFRMYYIPCLSRVFLHLVWLTGRWNLGVLLLTSGTIWE